MSDTISSAPRENSALDYASLRAEGQTLIPTVSSDTWTDYNTHDPGITILELLCYALTDFDYRIGQPMRDLLQPAPGTTPPADTSFLPAEILPTRPTTLTDYRKLLIDLDGVRNAWLAPIEGEEAHAAGELPLFIDRETERLGFVPKSPLERIDLKGFYRAHLLLDEDADQEATIAAAEKALRKYRNLCEEAILVEEVPREEVAVCLDLVIEPTVDRDELTAQILLALDQAIQPRIPFFSLPEMVDEGLSAEEIFLGPMLKNGFVTATDIERSDLPEAIRISDLIQVLHDIPGIVAVKRILLTGRVEGSEPMAGEPWALLLKSGHAPVFDPDNSRFRYFLDEIPAGVSILAARDRCLELQQLQPHRKSASKELAYPAEAGRYVAPETYASLQREFPLCYGVGPHGLSPDAGDLRKAQATQLKAYLHFFEQILANGCAQLASLSHLFSVGSETRTRFGQVPFDIPDLTDLLTNAATYFDRLEKIMEDGTAFVRRRNQFLDHLLGRFAETFADFATALRHLYGSEAEVELVESKRTFLGAYPIISTHRGGAMDVSHWGGGTSNLSGVERRLQLLLELDLSHLLAEDLLARFDLESTVDEEGVTQWRVLFKIDDDSFLTGNTRHASREAAEGEIPAWIAFGQFEASYEIFKERAQRFFFRLVDRNGVVMAARTRPFRTKTAAKEAAASAQDLLTTVGATESLFLLEHLLLRPRDTQTSRLPPCLKDEGDHAPCLDPYSFRVTYVLPAWPERFRHLGFRHWVERAVREHTPAHIFPKICWIDEGSMRLFAAAYWQWRRDLAAYTAALPDALSAAGERLAVAVNSLLAIWRQLRSEFPEATLHDCVNLNDANPVVLDNTQLGTFRRTEDAED